MQGFLWSLLARLPPFQASPFGVHVEKPRANPSTKGPSSIDRLFSLTCRPLSLGCTLVHDKSSNLLTRSPVSRSQVHSLFAIFAPLDQVLPRSLSSSSRCLARETWLERNFSWKFCLILANGSFFASRYLSVTRHGVIFQCRNTMAN